MRECERFAQVAQDKWANRSVFWANRSCSLLLTKNEQFAQKNLKKSYFGTFLHFLEVFLKMLIPSERSERIAQVAQDKWATVSDLLRSLRRNELSWANRSDRSPNISELLTFWANRSFAHFFLPKNKRFAPKFDDWIPYPVMVIHDSPFL